MFGENSIDVTSLRGEEENPLYQEIFKLSGVDKDNGVS